MLAQAPIIRSPLKTGFSIQVVEGEVCLRIDQRVPWGVVLRILDVLISSSTAAHPAVHQDATSSACA
jgi:hypothetical protein